MGLGKQLWSSGCGCSLYVSVRLAGTVWSWLLCGGLRVHVGLVVGVCYSDVVVSAVIHLYRFGGFVVYGLALVVRGLCDVFGLTLRGKTFGLATLVAWFVGLRDLVREFMGWFGGFVRLEYSGFNRLTHGGLRCLHNLRLVWPNLLSLLSLFNSWDLGLCVQLELYLVRLIGLDWDRAISMCKVGLGGRYSGEWFYSERRDTRELLLVGLELYYDHWCALEDFRMVFSWLWGMFKCGGLKDLELIVREFGC